jgi:hypothetical protein
LPRLETMTSAHYGGNQMAGRRRKVVEDGAPKRAARILLLAAVVLISVPFAVFVLMKRQFDGTEPFLRPYTYALAYMMLAGALLLLLSLTMMTRRIQQKGDARTCLVASLLLLVLAAALFSSPFLTMPLLGIAFGREAVVFFGMAIWPWLWLASLIVATLAALCLLAYFYFRKHS